MTSDPIAVSLDAMVDDFTAAGMAFDRRFGDDPRNRAIGLVNYAGNVMTAMGDAATDPEIVSKVGKLIAGESCSAKKFLDATHPKFAEDVIQYVEIAKTLVRGVPLTIKHN